MEENHKPLVSVVMITYGHEKYIKKAIEGVLMQKCNFKFELIISNDCSPDNTNNIVNENLLFDNKNIIKYTRHEHNMGMMNNFLWTLNQCKGNYVALCEGDDYWTDPLKLQKQVDFLESNLDYVLCFHQVKILKPEGVLVNDFITKVPEHYENQDTLARLGNYIHTPSVVFRNVINHYPNQLNRSPIGDFFLYMLLSSHGKLKYFEETMCVYREGIGVWSKQSKLNRIYKTSVCQALLVSYFKNDKKITEILLNRIINSAIFYKYKIKSIVELVIILPKRSLFMVLKILSLKIKVKLLTKA